MINANEISIPKDLHLVFRKEHLLVAAERKIQVKPFIYFQYLDYLVLLRLLYQHLLEGNEWKIPSTWVRAYV